MSKGQDDNNETDQFGNDIPIPEPSPFTNGKGEEISDAVLARHSGAGFGNEGATPDLQSLLTPEVIASERLKTSIAATLHRMGESGHSAWLHNRLIQGLSIPTNRKGAGLSALAADIHDEAADRGLKLSVAKITSTAKTYIAETKELMQADMAAKVANHPDPAVTKAAERKGEIARSIASTLQKGDGPRWAFEITTDKDGAAIANAQNVGVVTRSAPGLHRKFGLSEFDGQIWVLGRLPWEKEFDGPRWVKDVDVINLHHYLQTAFHPAVKKADVQDAVMAAASANRFDPLKDYLNRVGDEWDGTKRLGTFATEYLNAKIDPEIESHGTYLAVVSRKFLLSIVARGLVPGCKQDQVLLMTGPQGYMKSSAVEALCPDPDWFSDSLPIDLSHKDAMQHLLGKWIIEIPEIDKYKGRPATTVKAFITKRDDKFRMPYGRHEVKEKRRCSFLGSANSDEPLHDTTGNRRYWTISVGSTIDVEKIRRDRDQLIGEAVVAFRGGETWWLGPEYEAILEAVAGVQKKHTETDPWVAVIAEWIEQQNIKKTYINEVLRWAFGMLPAEFGRRESDRVRDSLITLGWAKTGNRHRRNGWEYAPE